jgi:hypothetical protein
MDIKDTLSEMVSRLPHFTSESGRYWFTPFPSVIEYVEKKAAEKLREPRLDLYREITECVEGIRVRKEKRGVEEVGAIFDENSTHVLGYGGISEEVRIDDEPKPRLVVLIKPEVSEEEVRNLIFMRGNEGRRTYRNTVVVVCPHQQADFKALLTFAAKVKSANEVMESLAEYYTDKDIRDLQQKKLKEYIQDNTRLLNEHLLSVLTRIAYPVKEAGKDEIKWTTTSAASAIIPQVEAGLRNPATGPKIRTDISFRDLADFLKKNQNWDLIEGTSRYTFRNILDTFYTVTSAPLTTRQTIEEAVKSGIETLDIGVLMDGKLYWKRIGHEDGAEVPSRLSDNAEILPYKIAAEIMRGKLLAESGIRKIGNEVHEIWFEVEILGKKLKLEDLIYQKDWEKILKTGKVLKEERIIATSFIITLQPSSLTVKVGEQVKVKAVITPIDYYDYPVSISVEKGSVNPERGKPPLESIWDLGKLEEIGDHTFKIKAIGEDGTESTSILNVKIESLEEEIETDKLDLTYVGAKLTHVIPQNLVSMQMVTEILSKLNQEAVVQHLNVKLEENISLSCKDIDSKLAGYLIQKFREIEVIIKPKDTHFIGILKLKQPLTLDSLKIASLTPLNGKALFKISVIKR